MNGNVFILVLIALLAMSLITRCDIRHAAGQVPKVPAAAQVDLPPHTGHARPAATRSR